MKNGSAGTCDNVQQLEHSATDVASLDIMPLCFSKCTTRRTKTFFKRERDMSRISKYNERKAVSTLLSVNTAQPQLKKSAPDEMKEGKCEQLKVLMTCMDKRKMQRDCARVRRRKP
ncbi:hypothetical protein DPMN_101496 [Dreissena polymorpha]|uniref:Uncharacterized protein n=1 Tax=Dreissena polymorpha TaxID=45954 RepID=A0A9D4RA43_DREPO|nr:hypothetical protein DPMN_101496 [Dreissena polymorpha]